MTDQLTEVDMLDCLRSLLREVIEEDDDNFFMGENWRERADKALGTRVVGRRIDLCTSAAAQESKA